MSNNIVEDVLLLPAIAVGVAAAAATTAVGAVALAVACLVCTVISFNIGALVAAALTAFLGVTAIGKNKKDLIWSVVLIIFAVFLALGSIGIL